MKKLSTTLAAALALAAPLAASAAEPAGTDQMALGKRGFFYVGGEYVGPAGKRLMKGQMYVEVLTPRKVTGKYPLVLIHGAAQTATNWMMTPDGRKGWADHFVEKGHIVYMVDQPARARSPWHPDQNGPLRMFTAEQLQTLFTASRELGKWPQAKKHTQWPGSGKMGDPAFDAFYATQVQSLKSDAETQTLTQKAGAALLDKIGPAILVTHSQSGLLGWVIAEARPALVKGIVAIEPSGPPFHNNNPKKTKARAYGITDIPVTYDPPVKDATEIATEVQAKADGPDLIACTLQKAPARKLKNFLAIPTLITVSESSYHAPYDHCTAKYMQQAGARVEFVRLQDKGIRGNGHMVMLEKNNLQVADYLLGWIATNIK